MPFFLKGLPRACTRYLIGDRYSADLKVPRAGWTTRRAPTHAPRQQDVLPARLLRPHGLAVREAHALPVPQLDRQIVGAGPPSVALRAGGRVVEARAGARYARDDSLDIRSRTAGTAARRAPRSRLGDRTPVYDAQGTASLGEAGRWNSEFSALSKRSVPTDRWCCAVRSDAACSRSCWCTAVRCCRPIVSSTRSPTNRRRAARPARCRRMSHNCARCCRSSVPN